MKSKLDWQTNEVVNIFDESSLWSAPFVQLMLEHIPMKRGAQIVDVGFGTGVPLIELAQRFGDKSTIYGIDLWKAAIDRTREKIRVLDLNNVTIFEQSAELIPLSDNSIDLICSNLGVNNFDNKEIVLQECHRVLKNKGHLCITTNPIGTFKELFLLFERVMREMKLINSLNKLTNYIAHRETVQSIASEFASVGFTKTKAVHEQMHMRFVDGKALFNHGLMRIGFLAGWQEFIPTEHQTYFFGRVAELIDEIVLAEGIFCISIPMVYMEFIKDDYS